jgi:hypothetical protein
MAKTTEQATMTVTTTVASDPVFAVIEAHRVADSIRMPSMMSTSRSHRSRRMVAAARAARYTRPGRFKASHDGGRAHADRLFGHSDPRQRSPSLVT